MPQPTLSRNSPAFSSGKPRSFRARFMEAAMSPRVSTRVPSRSKITHLYFGFIYGVTIISFSAFFYYPIKHQEILPRRILAFGKHNPQAFTFVHVRAYCMQRLCLKEFSMSDRISLVRPDISHKEAAREFIAEFREHNSTPNGSGGLDRYSEDYEGWLGKLEREADEKTVESGKVPADTRFAIRKEDSKLIGMINIRHRLNDFLLNRGGHIGYCIRPLERGKGYATEMLGLGLGLCRELGLERALVTCDRNNIPSARTIQHHGGILENEVFNKESSSYVQRYWIKVDEALAARDPVQDQAKLRGQGI